MSAVTCTLYSNALVYRNKISPVNLPQAAKQQRIQIAIDGSSSKMKRKLNSDRLYPPKYPPYFLPLGKEYASRGLIRSRSLVRPFIIHVWTICLRNSGL